MTAWLTALVLGVNIAVVGYVLTLDLLMLCIVVAGGLRVALNDRWAGTDGHRELFASPLTPAVSILIPAHDEEAGVLDTLAAALGQRYPALEVVLVDDGSTDATFDLVAERYELQQVTARPTSTIPVEGRIISVHRSPIEDLLVIRKESVGRRSDALNCALNHARHPLVCMVDADSLLEPDALLHVVRPFVDDPVNVVGSGGVIRTANGSLTDRGRVLEPRLSRRWVARIQTVEYLRSFLLGRTAWADARALIIISGAFGLFRRDLVLEVGGLDPTSLAEDAELVVTLHEHLARHGRPHRMVFVPEPVCWTEVPESWAVLGRQRKRWAHGLAQLLWKHRRMIGNPRFGAVGLLALPFFVLFELLGPVVEVLGLVAVALAAALGLLDPGAAFAVLGLALTLAGLLSTAAVVADELFVHRYRRTRDLVRLLLAGVVENLGFRQFHAWVRLRGTVAALTRRAPVWTPMPRTGFTTSPTVDAPAG